MRFDYLIAGAGLSGSVLARSLADAGHRVLVVEKDRHIGGMAYDEYDEHGVLVHRYGGHYFHANSESVVAFLSRFTDWHPYEHRVLASVEGRLLPLPINLDTINTLYGLALTPGELEEWLHLKAEPRERIENAEDAVVSKIGRDLYRLFFEGYTRKHWGMDPRELGPQLTARIPVRTNRDDRYFTDRFQMMPKHGYTKMFERMLDHEGITLLLGADAREVLEELPPRCGTIWTGPIDGYFDHRLGRLPYRSLRFTYESFPGGLRQPVAQVNYPNAYGFTRTMEFRHATGQESPYTTIMTEWPSADGPPFYPVPSPASERLLKAYKELAQVEAPSVYFTGRLGSYRYYNMDQVIAQSLKLAEELIATGSVG